MWWLHPPLILVHAPRLDLQGIPVYWRLSSKDYPWKKLVTCFCDPRRALTTPRLRQTFQSACLCVSCSWQLRSPLLRSWVSWDLSRVSLSQRWIWDKRLELRMKTENHSNCSVTLHKNYFPSSDPHCGILDKCSDPKCATRRQEERRPQWQSRPQHFFFTWTMYSTDVVVSTGAAQKNNKGTTTEHIIKHLNMNRFKC